MGHVFDVPRPLTVAQELPFSTSKRYDTSPSTIVKGFAMSIIVRVLLIATFMITVMGFLQAQSPPQELEGQFHGDHSSIELQWHHPDGDNDPQFYNVYRKAGGDTSFQLLSAAGDDKYDDSQITLLASYHYYVTAVYAGNVESPPSNIIDVTASGDSAEDSSQVALHFTSAPVLIAFVNQAYSYDADVEALPATGDICFSLHEGPAGMTINGATGVIEWTPASLGVFEVEIRAGVCTGGEGEAEQRYDEDEEVVEKTGPGHARAVDADDKGKICCGQRHADHPPFFHDLQVQPAVHRATTG